MNDDMPAIHLDLSQASQCVGRAIATIREMVRSGKIERQYGPDGRLLIHARELRSLWPLASPDHQAVPLPPDDVDAAIDRHHAVRLDRKRLRVEAATAQLAGQREVVGTATDESQEVWDSVPEQALDPHTGMLRPAYAARLENMFLAALRYVIEADKLVVDAQEHRRQALEFLLIFPMTKPTD